MRFIWINKCLLPDYKKYTDLCVNVWISSRSKTTPLWIRGCIYGTEKSHADACTVAFCLSCMFVMVFPGLWKASAVFPTPFTLDGTLKRGKKKRKSKKSIGLVIRRQPPSRCSCCRSGLVPTSRNVLLGFSSLDTSLHLQQDPDSGLSLMASWCSFSYLSLPPIHPSFHSLTNHSHVPSPMPGELSTSGRSFIPPRP